MNTSDAPLKEGVSREEQLFFGQMITNAAGGMAGGVDHKAGDLADH